MNWMAIINFLIHNTLVPWVLLGLALLVHLVGVSLSKFSESKAIGLAVDIPFGWLPVCMLLSLFSETYGLYMLYWFLSFIVFALFFAGLSWICSKYGKRYKGDGGMVLVIPGYLFIATFILSLIIKAVITLIYLI